MGTYDMEPISSTIVDEVEAVCAALAGIGQILGEATVVEGLDGVVVLAGSILEPVVEGVT
jgi:hypothetical protein